MASVEHPAHMHVPTLFPLDTSEVRRRWGFYIRSGVASALEFDTEGAMPEDVFASLMGGHSHLFMAFDQDDPTRGPLGFIIAREIFTPGGKELLSGWPTTTATTRPAPQTTCRRLLTWPDRPGASASQSKVHAPTTARFPA
jgi:hypothetical protein